MKDWKSEAKRDAGHKYKYQIQIQRQRMKRLLSGLQATKNEDEILKPEMPEFLKIDFLEEKFKNECLLCAGGAPATTAEEPDERRKLVRVEVTKLDRQLKRSARQEGVSATSSTTTKGWRTER